MLRSFAILHTSVSPFWFRNEKGTQRTRTRRLRTQSSKKYDILQSQWHMRCPEDQLEVTVLLFHHMLALSWIWPTVACCIISTTSMLWNTGTILHIYIYKVHIIYKIYTLENKKKSNSNKSILYMFCFLGGGGVKEVIAGT